MESKGILKVVGNTFALTASGGIAGIIIFLVIAPLALILYKAGWYQELS